MAELYNKKLVISGQIVELYEYNHFRILNPSGFSQSSGGSENEEKTRSKFSQTRSSLNIRALVNSNPSLQRFLTLTYAKNIKDLTISNYEFKKFIQRVKTLYQNIKYVCVVEFQKRGAVHYHLIWDTPFIKKTKVAKLWGHGFIKLNRVRDVRNLGAYFAKHGTKGKDVESKKLAGRKKFFCSRGLERPLILRRQENVNAFIEKNLKGLDPFFSKSFKNDDLTTVYKQFKIEISPF